MILVTGTRGFVGKSLVPLLDDNGHSVRCLAQSRFENENTDNFSRGDLVVASMDDSSALRQAMVGVDTIIHLASAQCYGGLEQLMEAMSFQLRQLVQEKQKPIFRGFRAQLL